jgi:hypothetical protein
MQSAENDAVPNCQADRSLQQYWPVWKSCFGEFDLHQAKNLVFGKIICHLVSVKNEMMSFLPSFKTAEVFHAFTTYLLAASCYLLAAIFLAASC